MLFREDERMEENTEGRMIRTGGGRRMKQQIRAGKEEWVGRGDEQTEDRQEGIPFGKWTAFI